MKKLLSSILLISLILLCLITKAHGITQDVAVEPDTVSAVEVIGYFEKNDTLIYELQNARWKISPTDTVLTAGVTSRVRVVVTDSTAEGYKMDYTYLDIDVESLSDNPYSVEGFLTKISEILGKKLLGTTIGFETNEYGAVTGFDNIGKIKKQAKKMFGEVWKEVLEIPEYKNFFKETGIDVNGFLKMFDTDKIVEGYLEDINTLFIFHGKRFPVGKVQWSEDASDTDFETEYISSAGIDMEEEYYYVVRDVTELIPEEELAKLSADVLKSMKLKDRIREMEDAVQETKGAKCNYYYGGKFLLDGWPYKVVKRESTIGSGYGNLSQTSFRLEYINR